MALTKSLEVKSFGIFFVRKVWSRDSRNFPCFTATSAVKPRNGKFVGI